MPLNPEDDRSVGLAPPSRLELLGDGERPPANHAMDATAVIVFHGMGQQVKFETLDQLAQALIEAHEAKGEKSAKRVRHVWCDDRDGGRFMPRAEVELQDANGNARKTVHIYEAYWAPQTEGAISFGSTAAFFLKAGVRGIGASLRDDRKFLRWAFGREREFPLAPATFIALVLATLFLALVVLALLYFAGYFWPAGVDGLSLDTIARTWRSTLLVIAAIVVSWKIRRWMVQYLGDVAIYVSSSELDKHWRIREEIKRD